MTYKRKLLILSSLTAALALIYVLTLVFDPDRRGSRSDRYSWLDPRLRDSVDGIDIRGGGDSPEGVSLLRRNGIWLVLRGGREYPAQEGRIDDFLDELSRRDSYPRRSASPSSHGRFGLGERAPRITVRGGAGRPLLELLAGNSDAGGEHIFLRKAGSNEVRSGRDRISSYLGGDAKSWFNLRLFPESGNDGLTTEFVQRLTVRPPAEGFTARPPAGEEETGEGTGGEGPPPEPVEISRVQHSWRISAGARSLEPEDIEKTRVDSYITGILNTTGEDFVSFDDFPDFSDFPGHFPESASLSLELADGRVLILRLGPAEASGQRPAVVSGGYVYTLAAWAVERLFREPEYFRRSGESGR
jgi:hypothetical protein